MSRTILFLILCGALTTACGTRESEVAVLCNMYIDNKTDKELLYFLNTEVGEDSVHLKGQDFKMMSFEKKTKFEISNLSSGRYLYEKFSEFSVISHALYDLADTVAYQQRNSEEEMNKIDSLFVARISGMMLDSEIYNGGIYSDTLTVDDELLMILEKDYSMLERFPEYYSRQ